MTAVAADGTYNIRLSPLGFTYGVTALEADIKLTDNISAGPMYIKFRDDPGLGSFGGYGARVDWHFNGVFDQGPLVAAFYRRGTEGAAGFEVNFNEFAALGGYRGMWGNVNITTELGLRSFNATTNMSAERDGDGMATDFKQWPVADVNVGWVF